MCAALLMAVLLVPTNVEFFKQNLIYQLRYLRMALNGSVLGLVLVLVLDAGKALLTYTCV